MVVHPFPDGRVQTHLQMANSFEYRGLDTGQYLGPLGVDDVVLRRNRYADAIAHVLALAGAERGQPTALPDHLLAIAEVKTVLVKFRVRNIFPRKR